MKLATAMIALLTETSRAISEQRRIFAKTTSRSAVAKLQQSCW
jgi:hypothetical protein